MCQVVAPAPHQLSWPRATGTHDVATVNACCVQHPGLQAVHEPLQMFDKFVLAVLYLQPAHMQHSLSHFELKA